MPRALTIRRFLWLCLLPGFLLAQATPQQIAYQLATRYTPYTDWASVLDVECLGEPAAEATEQQDNGERLPEGSRIRLSAPLGAVGMADLPADHLKASKLTAPSVTPVEAWWTTPEAMRSSRNGFADPLRKENVAEAGLSAVARSAKVGTAFDKPLSGLHLALDPGHIGGDWAQWEWRNFRISDDAFWVREGELVLEVAQRVRARLVSLGAEVTLLRESCQPINPKTFIDYWALAVAELEPPSTLTLRAQVDYALAVRNRALRLAIVTGEIAERARVVNQVIRPDALISLHINAAAWPEDETQQLVAGDHAHVLIFGCLSAQELASPHQRAQLVKKLTNGSGAIEAELGAALGSALAEATSLPASDYEGHSAIRIDPQAPYLWARNLMLLRLVDCPSVLLEPYIANSRRSYARIQKALAARAVHAPLPEDDILIEYADAVVDGVLRAYAPEKYSMSNVQH